MRCSWLAALALLFTISVSAHAQTGSVSGTVVDGSGAAEVNNLLNRTVQQHVFGDLLRRSVTGEVRFAF